jgi:hypothetical protein
LNQWVGWINGRVRLRVAAAAGSSKRLAGQVCDPGHGFRFIEDQRLLTREARNGLQNRDREGAAVYTNCADADRPWKSSGNVTARERLHSPESPKHNARLRQPNKRPQDAAHRTLKKLLGDDLFGEGDRQKR